MEKVRKIIIILVAVMLLYGTIDSYATNRIGNIVISHSTADVEVTLRGAPPQNDSDLSVTVAIDVAFLCQGPNNQSVDPGNPERQTLNFAQTKVIPSSAFDGNAEVKVLFSFDLESSVRCHQKKWQVVTNTALIVGATGTVTWAKQREFGFTQILSCETAQRGWSETLTAAPGVCQPECNGDCDETTWFNNCVPHQELTCMCAVHNSTSSVDCADPEVTHN